MYYPTLKQLEYLLALNESRHFGEAAKACHVTQSTLSASIKDLEDSLGLVLFERTNRKVVLTSSGARLIEQAKSIISECDKFVEMAMVMNAPFSGVMKVGVIPTIGPFLVPVFLHKLKDKFPDLQFHYVEGRSERLLNDLRAGHLDLVIQAFPYPHDGLDVEYFYDDPFWFVGPKDHAAFIFHPNEISIEDVPHNEILLLEEGHCLSDHTLAVCRFKEMESSAIVRATSIHTMVQMVSAGMGVTLVPQVAVRSNLLAGLEVRAIPLKERNIGRKIGLLWRSSSQRKAEKKAIAQALHEIIKNAKNQGL